MFISPAVLLSVVNIGKATMKWVVHVVSICSGTVLHLVVNNYLLGKEVTFPISLVGLMSLFLSVCLLATLLTTLSMDCDEIL